MGSNKEFSRLMVAPLTVSRNKYHTNRKKSSIPTPHKVIDFIYSIIPHRFTHYVLDPACGDGRLLKGVNSFGIDIEDNKHRRNTVEFTQGNFLEEDLIDRKWPSMVICNPPFNWEIQGKGLLPELFLKRIFELFNDKMPVVLFTPAGFRNNQRRKSERWRWLRDSDAEISSILTLPLDIFTPNHVMTEYKKKVKEANETFSDQNRKKEHLKEQRRLLGVVEFPTEVLFFNFLGLKTHYFLPEEALDD